MNSFGWILLAILIVCLVSLVLKLDKQRSEGEGFKELLLPLILGKAKEHIATLASKYSRCLTYDDYNKRKFNESGWEKEILYFIDSACSEISYPKELLKELIIKRLVKIKYLNKDNVTVTIAQHNFENIICAITELVESYLSEQTDINFSDIVTGVEFEEACKNILVKHGWQVQITKASGDQGTDLIATKDAIKVGIQCKLYSKPVGNKAVQEIVAGRTYYGFKHCAVVSNNSFTKSAQQLANTNNVFLLNPYQLADLERIIS